MLGAPSLTSGGAAVNSRPSSIDMPEPMASHSPSRYISRFLACLALVAWTSACTSKSPTSTRPRFSGTYVLVSVDGQPLPIISPPQTDGGHSELVSGAMAFADPDTVRVTQDSRYVQPDQPASGYTALGIYRYTSSGVTLHLTPVIAQYPMEASASTGSITLYDRHPDGSTTTLVFKRS